MELSAPGTATATYTTDTTCDYHNNKIATMADGGIDRKAEEKMEFSTSKEVTVHPTFESMSLKGKHTL